MASPKTGAKAILDTLPNEVLDHIFENLLKVTDEHCHYAGLTDREPDKDTAQYPVSGPKVSIFIPLYYKHTHVAASSKSTRPSLVSTID